MTKIIELAHNLGDAIAQSDEIRALGIAKDGYEKDADLQKKMSEYETDRALLGEQFSKDDGEADEKVIADLRARMEALSAEIVVNPNYAAFAEAQAAMNKLMEDVNAEIKFCITGERPSSCTHDCSTCHGCH